MKRILTVEIESEHIHVLNQYTDALHENVRRLASIAEMHTNEIGFKVSDKTQA